MTTTGGLFSDQVAVDGFDQFWQHYPRRQAKKDAEKAWRKLKPTPAETERILAALDEQRKGWTDLQFVPLPATWLRGERFNDETIAALKPSATVSKAENERIDRTLRAWGFCRHDPQCSSTGQCRGLLLARFRGEDES